MVGEPFALAWARRWPDSRWRLRSGLLLLAPTAERPFESVVVVLAGPDAKPALVATAERGSRYLTVKAVAAVDVPAGRALELWMLPDGRAPVSMGLVPASGIDRVALRAPAGVALQDIPALAVSVEPPGGSPTGAPTGPVILTGRVERIYLSRGSRLRGSSCRASAPCSSTSRSAKKEGPDAIASGPWQPLVLGEGAIAL